MFKTFLLFLILASSGLLRIWHGQELFFWNIDQDLISLVVKRIVEEGRPQLIGFPIPGGIYLGPIFYYLASVIYVFSGMNPLHIFIFSTLLATVTSFLVYRVGKEIFENETVGIIAAVIFSFSFLANVYSRSISGLTFAPILALLLYQQLYRSLKAKKVYSLFSLMAILVISSQMEGSTLSLLFLAIFIFVIYKVRIKLSQFLKLIAAFLIFHIPLLIFDLRHDFFLMKSVFNFTSRFGVESHLSPNNFLDVLSIFVNFMSRTLVVSGNNDISEQILDCSHFVAARLSSISPISFFLAIIAIGFFVFSVIFKKKSVWGEKIIMTHLSVMILGLIAYNLFLPGYLHEWILVIFLPATCFIFALFLTNLFKMGVQGRVFVVFFLIIFSILNIRSALTSKNIDGLENRVEATKIALDIAGNRPFYLVSLGSCFAQGYIYLFDYFGNRPLNVEGLIYDTAFFTQGTKPGLGIVLASPSKSENAEYFLKYDAYQKRATSSQKIGNIELLIIEHE